MKHLLFSIVALFLLSTTTIYAQNKTVNVEVKIIKNIRNDNTRNISEAAVVSKDVLSNGKVIISAGTPVNLDIESSPARGLGREGRITMNLVSTQNVNGESIKLDGSQTNSGKNRRGAAIGCGVTFGIILCPIGLLFLCIKGQKAIIPAGSIIMGTAQLN